MNDKRIVNYGILTIVIVFILILVSLYFLRINDQSILKLVIKFYLYKN